LQGSITGGVALAFPPKEKRDLGLLVGHPAISRPGGGGFAVCLEVLVDLLARMFGFAPTFRFGKSSGSSGLFGESFDASYGEAAEFEYTS
jgi:hypothetical protein